MMREIATLKSVRVGDEVEIRGQAQPGEMVRVMVWQWGLGRYRPYIGKVQRVSSSGDMLTVLIEAPEQFDLFL